VERFVDTLLARLGLQRRRSRPLRFFSSVPFGFFALPLALSLLGNAVGFHRAQIAQGEEHAVFGSHASGSRTRWANANGAYAGDGRRWKPDQSYDR
jgi:hypothetical protein